jgi:hypothetical protein
MPRRRAALELGPRAAAAAAPRLLARVPPALLPCRPRWPDHSSLTLQSLPPSPHKLTMPSSIPPPPPFPPLPGRSWKIQVRKVLSADKIFRHTGLKQKHETIWQLDQVGLGG